MEKHRLQLYSRIIADHDDHLVVNKAAGFASQSSRDPLSPNLHGLLEDELKTKLHLLTRLDQPVSGLCLLSKNQHFTRLINKAQEKGDITKQYLAIVEGRLELDNKTLVHYLMKNSKKRKAIVSDISAKGMKEVESIANTLLVLDRYSLLAIKIKSGKFHQIRAQLAHIGHPVKGDVKYGARRSNKTRFIHLHSWKLDLRHPDNKELNYEAELPKNDDLWQLVAKDKSINDG